MYAIAIIIIFGLLATLMTFAVWQPPALPVQPMLSPASLPATQEDIFRKDNIEQYILSMCDARKAEGKGDVYPDCPGGPCNAEVLRYSDLTVDLDSVFGPGRARKSDGGQFSFNPITVRTCDASEFIH